MKNKNIIWLVVIVIIVIVIIVGMATQDSGEDASSVIGVSTLSTSLPPKPQISPSEQLSLEQKCSEDGKDFVSAYETENGSGTVQTIWFDPEYHFDTRLNTCLADIAFNEVFYQAPFSELTTNGATEQVIQNNNEVYDIYANRAVLQSDVTRTYVYNNTSDKQDETDTLAQYPMSQDTQNLTNADFSTQLKYFMSE